MEPDAAFVWQSESCNLTQECKEQRSRKAEKPGGAGTCSQAAKTCQHSWPESGEDRVSFRPFFTKESEYKGVRPCHSRSTAELYWTAVPAGKYSVKTSIINPNLWTKGVPKPRCCPHGKVKAKKNALRHFPCFCPLKLGFIAASLRSKIYKNSWKYINNSYWHLEDIWIIFNCCILIKKLPLATHSLMIRQRDI